MHTAHIFPQIQIYCDARYVSRTNFSPHEHIRWYNINTYSQKKRARTKRARARERERCISKRNDRYGIVFCRTWKSVFLTDIDHLSWKCRPIFGHAAVLIRLWMKKTKTNSNNSTSFLITYHTMIYSFNLMPWNKLKKSFFFGSVCFETNVEFLIRRAKIYGIYSITSYCRNKWENFLIFYEYFENSML